MSERTPRPSEQNENGNNLHTAGKNIAAGGKNIGTLAAAIIRDVLDGDNDYRTAIRAANEISELGFDISLTGWSIADGNFTEAKRASLGLKEKRGEVKR